MTPLEDMIRGAIRAKAGEVPPEAVPPLRLPSHRRSFSLAYGGGERRGAPARRDWRGWLAPAASAVLVAAVLAGSVALSHLMHGWQESGRHQHSAAATPNIAAAWVFGQVSPAARVSCDPAMCLALAAHKIPRSDLLELGPGTADPLGADVIVATAAVRSMFGGRLSSVYAPIVLASFGSGRAQIDVRVIAPHGAAAYRAALAMDLLNRKASGAQLLQSPLILTSAEARKQLAAGQVDLRLLYTIADMAAQPSVDAQHPVDIVAFGDSAPGASAGIPLRSADLTQGGGGARASGSAGVRSMLAHLRAQGGPPYPYGRATIVRLARGKIVLRIEFAAPSPLGLGNVQRSA
jgi:hypothetical protein